MSEINTEAFIFAWGIMFVVFIIYMLWMFVCHPTVRELDLVP